MRDHRTRLRPILIAAVSMLLAAGSTSGSAWAQLTNDVMGVRGDLSQSQVLVVEQHVNRYVGDLQKSDTSAAVRQAREQLVQPLDRSATTRDFRLAYSRILTPQLRSVLESAEAAVPTKINALIVLGKLASEESIAALQPHLQSELDALRYTASMAHRLAFDQMRLGLHTFNPATTLTSVSRSLADAFAAERQPVVMHAQIEAVAALPDPAMAIETMTNGIERQVADMHVNGDGSNAESVHAPGARVARIRESLDAAMRRYTDLIGVNPTVRRQQQRELAITAAVILVMATDKGAGDDILEAAAPDYEALVRTAENILNVVTGQTTANKQVSEAFEAGRHGEAQRALNAFWLSDTGPLYGDAVRSITRNDIAEALKPGN